MLPRVICDLVGAFAYGNMWKYPFEFMVEVNYLDAFHKSIPEAFVRATYFDVDQSYCRPSPFRKGMPYTPLKKTQCHQTFDAYNVKNIVKRNVAPIVWRRAKTYPKVAMRKLVGCVESPCSHQGWNAVVRLFSRIDMNQLKPWELTHPVLRDLLEGLQEGRYRPFPKVQVPVAEDRFRIHTQCTRRTDRKDSLVGL